MIIILKHALVDFCSKFQVYLNFAAILGDTGEVDVEGSFSSSDCEEFSASWASISSSYLSYGTAIISGKQNKQNLADLETMVLAWVPLLRFSHEDIQWSGSLLTLPQQGL